MQLWRDASRLVRCRDPSSSQLFDECRSGGALTGPAVLTRVRSVLALAQLTGCRTELGIAIGRIPLSGLCLVAQPFDFAPRFLKLLHDGIAAHSRRRTRLRGKATRQQEGAHEHCGKTNGHNQYQLRSRTSMSLSSASADWNWLRSEPR